MFHEASRRLSWSDNDQLTKALVVLGDATPHPPSFTDQRIHWKQELEILKQKGVKARCYLSKTYKNIHNIL